MKEKRYTLPEEQKDAAFVAESAPAYHGNAAMALPEDECAEEDSLCTLEMLRLFVFLVWKCIEI